MDDIKNIAHINKWCISRSFPCKHSVIVVLENNKPEFRDLDIQDIYNLCIKFNFPIPEHIQNQKDFIEIIKNFN
jgi:hypothetical protein